MKKWKKKSENSKSSIDGEIELSLNDVKNCKETTFVKERYLPFGV